MLVFLVFFLFYCEQIQSSLFRQCSACGCLWVCVVRVSPGANALVWSVAGRVVDMDFEWYRYPVFRKFWKQQTTVVLLHNESQMITYLNRPSCCFGSGNSGVITECTNTILSWLSIPNIQY